MKYWLLTTEYPPHYGGGIGTYTYYTARMLRDKGDEVTVFLYDMSLSEDKISIENNIRLVRFVPRKTGTHGFIGFNANISFEYARVIQEFVRREGKPDILESQEYHAISYYIQQFKWLGYEHFVDMDILITCHAPSFLCLEYNHVPVYQLPYYWTGQMEKSCIRSADILISPSRYFVGQMQERMNWEGISESYVPNPIEVSTSNIVSGYKENYIVCFGKLSPLKGTFELLSYFKNLWDEGFPHPLHIIGGTDQFFHPEGMTMKDFVKKKYRHCLDKKLLLFEGELSPLDAKQKILEAHVVLVPSIVDNLPYTVLEAMSWGKIVLASVQGGQSEIIDNGKNGFLFDHNMPGDFQNKLSEILQLSQQKVNMLGIAAIQTIQSRYAPEIVYKKKMTLIHHHLENKMSSTVFPFIENMSESKILAISVNSTSELLSIIVPHYNMGAHLQECIDSIIKTTYGHKEIIIVDDGSTDEKSLQLLRKMEENYPVKVFRKQNEGLPLTRNFGATKASGRYLAFLDADDSIEETYYTKAINVLKKYENVHFVGCWVKYFGESSGNWPTFNPEPPFLLLHNTINSSAIVCKRDSFIKHGMNDPAFCYGMEDWDSVINMVKNNCGGVVLPEVLFNYRVRKNSMSRSFTRIKRLHLHRLIGLRHRSIYQKYGNELVQLLNANGSGLYIDNPTFDSPVALPVSLPIAGILARKIREKVKKNKYIRKVVYKIYKHIKTD